MKRKVQVRFPVLTTITRKGFIEIPDNIDPDQWLQDNIDNIINIIDKYSEAYHCPSKTWFTKTNIKYLNE